ncbi:hypothetical protein OR573_07100 [Halomonas sp. CH40]
MSFHTMLEIAEPNRSEAIRKAFAPYTPLLEVSCNTEAAVVVLLNLSHKRQSVPEVLDKNRAAATLKDWKHIENCAQEVQWLHSHNLKYPDTRVAHQRLLLKAEKPSANVVSSFDSVSCLGWSHNSAAVNKAKLFGTQFKFYGIPYCLATIILDNNQRWWEELKKLGMSDDQWIYLQSLFDSYFNTNITPSSVDRRSVQVTFFYQGKDISITPVVSNSLLTEIQISRRQKNGKFSKIKHWHPASVGDLVSSLGGHVSALDYPPFLNSRQRYKKGVNVSFVDKVDIDFYHRALKSRAFISACLNIIESKNILTSKERKDYRRSAIKLLSQSLTEWLSPIIYWRGMEGESNEGEGSDIAILLTSASDESLLENLSELNRELHNALIKNPRTQSLAYHPDLLIPFKSQLKVLLKGLKKQEGEYLVEESFCYLHLKNVHVFDAQALSCPYLVGLPSLMAVWGTVYNYQLRLKNLLDRNIVIDGVAWFLRQYEFSSGAQIPAPYLPPAKPGEAPKRPGLIDMRFCDLRMDLVIRYRLEDGHDISLKDDDLPMLQAAFPSRFAGGTMQPPPLHQDVHWCQLHRDASSLFEAISLLPVDGRWIVDSDDQVEKIDSLVAWLSKHPNHLPALSGYQLLEVPCSRQGAHRHLHAYAEPLVSLVETVSPMSFRLKSQTYFLKNAFWRLKSQNLTMLMKKI